MLTCELLPKTVLAPNVYNIPYVLGDKKSAPAYTISGRNKQTADERVKNPGPGTYNYVDPENYKQHSPAYTISGRTNIPSDITKIPGPGVYSPEKVKRRKLFALRFQTYKNGLLPNESNLLNNLENL